MHTKTIKCMKPSDMQYISCEEKTDIVWISLELPCCVSCPDVGALSQLVMSTLDQTSGVTLPPLEGAGDSAEEGTAAGKLLSSGSIPFCQSDSSFLFCSQF